jgi:hypothetical protein
MALIVQIALAFILLFWLLTTAAAAQTPGQETSTTAVQKKTETVPAPVSAPVLKNYREVAIGMTADAVREKLGKAKIQDKDGFYYEFSDGEAAQLTLDADGRVRVISIIYQTKGGSPPKFEDVFGAGVSAEPRENGAVYHLVRYPEAGYWVAYSRAAGENAVVTVTIQKL